MEIEVVSRKENMLTGRTEVVFKAVHLSEKTPKRAEIKEKLAELLGVSKSNVVIDNMKPEFGRPESRGYAKVYKNIEGIKEMEMDYILMRNNLLEKKEKKVEERKEAKKEEKEKVKSEEEKKERVKKKVEKEEKKIEEKGKKTEEKEKKVDEHEKETEKKKLKEEKSEKKEEAQKK
ncbi:MAG: hypothetical protein QMC80_01415 [Thermoplasmatales archaeon]|nr:hypothetical protein [Thermoplasmatales archaeon]